MLTCGFQVNKWKMKREWSKLAIKKLATATLETLMPRIEGKGEFGQARWRLAYAPQIPSLLSLNPSGDPLKSLVNNMFSGAEVEIHLGKRLQASMVSRSRTRKWQLNGPQPISSKVVCVCSFSLFHPNASCLSIQLHLRTDLRHLSGKVGSNSTFYQDWNGLKHFGDLGPVRSA